MPQTEPLICPVANCGARREPVTDGQGRVVFACPRCARKRSGICRDCPCRTRNTRCIRCADCAYKHRLERGREMDRESYRRRRRRKLAYLKRYYADPERRERRRRYAARYYRAYPRTEYDRVQAREASRRYRQRQKQGRQSDAA